MRTVITYMYRLDPYTWRVHLECSHKFTVTAQELEEHRLFIGKRVTCLDCERNRQRLL